MDPQDKAMVARKIRREAERQEEAAHKLAGQVGTVARIRLYSKREVAQSLHRIADDFDEKLRP
jgi:hypothetical protein